MKPPRSLILAALLLTAAAHAQHTPSVTDAGGTYPCAKLEDPATRSVYWDCTNRYLRADDALVEAMMDPQHERVVNYNACLAIYRSLPWWRRVWYWHQGNCARYLKPGHAFD